MKKRFFIFSFCLFSCFIHAQEGKERIWDFPVKPGSEKWASFATSQEMVDALQIPQDVLEKLSSKELAEICLDYPLFFNFSAYNDERVGISATIESFNGLKELSDRKDGAHELISLYKRYPIISQIQKEGSKDFDTPYKLPFLELLLSDETFNKQLDEQQSIELSQIVVAKYESKLNNAHVYSLHNIKKTFLLGAITIENHYINKKTTRQQETVKRFIDHYNNADSDLITDISRIISEL